MLDYEQTKRALLGGWQLAPVRDAAGTVTQYRLLYHGGYCGTSTFASLRHLLEDLGAGRWGLSAKGRYRLVAGCIAGVL